jgi:hypothetical protein
LQTLVELSPTRSPPVDRFLRKRILRNPLAEQAAYLPLAEQAVYFPLVKQAV